MNRPAIRRRFQELVEELIDTTSNRSPMKKEPKPKPNPSGLTLLNLNDPEKNLNSRQKFRIFKKPKVYESPGTNDEFGLFYAKCVRYSSNLPTPL